MSNFAIKFNFKMVFDGETNYYVKSHKEVSKFFEYVQEELDINGYDGETSHYEIIRGEWTLEDIADELDTRKIYVATENGVEIMAMDFDLGYSCDAFLMFTNEEIGGVAEYDLDA